MNTETSTVDNNAARAERVSSPAATGGAGTFFEQHVDAYLLALLLVRGFPPVLVDGVVSEVLFQTEHLGWKTDDFLVRASVGNGAPRLLAGQAKRNLRVSSGDAEFKQTIRDGWADFQNKEIFSPERDRLAIVVPRGTEALQVHFCALLDCARASRDAADFRHRLETPGFLDKTVAKHFAEVRAVIEALQGEKVGHDDLWPFLRVLHLLVLDLHSSSSQAEALVKSLLSHTTSDPAPAGAANATWDALLRLVGEGMPQATRFRRDDLPAELRQRHTPNARHDEVLLALREHSLPVLSKIRAGVGPGELHIRRDRLVTHVLAAIREHQVVVVTGPSGAGKSALSKAALEQLRFDHFAFAFRAEEFARAHIDETLHAAQIPARAVELSAILSGQDHKVLLIDSAERLLEAGTRDALTHLLELIRHDPTWRLVISCRDYSCQDVRTAFLERTGVTHTVIGVSNLDDPELGEVERNLPALARVLSPAPLRGLLRNPFYLDLACRLSWPADQPLPESERALRQRFWREVVRMEAYKADALPRRREASFLEVALRRARALTPYARCEDLDPVVLAVLERDSLLSLAPGTDAMAAPAHDVLEDWSLLHWLETLSEERSHALSAIADEVGGHPALRRAYRRFLIDLAGRDAALPSRYFEQAITSTRLPAYFRDDTLACLLRSSQGPRLLEQHTSRLLAEDQALLRRVIHLLRVTCVAPADWVPPSALEPALDHGPIGPSWPCVLAIVRQNIEAIAPHDVHLLLGLVEDWARGISNRSPLPTGAQDAVAISHWLLDHFDDTYSADDEVRRTLAVIAKFPLGDRQRFLALAGEKEEGRRTPAAVRPTRRARRFLDLLLNELDGVFAVRDLPDEIMAMARARWLLPEPQRDSREEAHWRRRSFRELEELFGLDSTNHDFFPPSAYHGPFLSLLQFHPIKGLDFVLELTNHCTEWYAHPRYPGRDIEPPEEFQLDFADGTNVTQWCNPRLWNLYRGTSVGPYLLQSALMGLERWLLDVASTNEDRDLEPLLLTLLKRSQSAAITAVVASVATAFPHRSGDALLALLRNPDCIDLDRARMVHEGAVPTGLLPMLRTNELHEAERQQARDRGHRRLDLEAAARTAQLGPLHDRVHEILDRHRTEVLARPQQGERELLWRLALDRMDLRCYRATVVEDPRGNEADAGEGRRQLIKLELEGVDPQIQSLVTHSQAERQPMEAELSLHLWGLGILERQEKWSADPALWRAQLDQARSTQRPPELFWCRDGRPFVAAVCVRDHWGELSSEDQAWAIETICGAIDAGHTQSGPGFRSEHDFTGAKEAAFTLSLLLTKSLAAEQRQRTLQGLANALTHPTTQVVWFACNGVAEYLWKTDAALALRCANAVALQGRLLSEELRRPRRRSDTRTVTLDELQSEESTELAVREAATLPAARAVVLGSGPEGRDECLNHDPSGWIGVETLIKLLLLLRTSLQSPLAHQHYAAAARSLAESWGEEARERRARHGPEAVPLQLLGQLPQLLAQFTIRLEPQVALEIMRPLVEGVEEHAREVARVLHYLLFAQDPFEGKSSYWEIWQAFADRIRRARWVAHARQRSGEHELLQAIFVGLSTEWKSSVRHWPRLAGQEARLHSLIAALPPSAAAFESYVGFFYAIGQQSLPEGFTYLADLLRRETSVQLSFDNTISMLESILRRYVYGHPHAVKRSDDLRKAVLFILDALVERGSSVAYRMRDDFVTPLPK